MLWFFCTDRKSRPAGWWSCIEPPLRSWNAKRINGTDKWSWCFTLESFECCHFYFSCGFSELGFRVLRKKRPGHGERKREKREKRVRRESSWYMEKSAKYLYWLTVPTALDPSWQQGQRSDCVFMWKYSGEVCVGVWRTIEWSPIHSTVLLVQTNVRALRLRNILWKTKALWTLTKLKNKVSHVYKI